MENPQMNSREGNRIELIVMTLELENGQTEKLRIFEEDDPMEVAIEFGLKHSLEQEIVEALAYNIEENMKNTLEELREKEKSVLSMSIYSERPQRFDHGTPQSDIQGMDMHMVNPKFNEFSPIYNMNNYNGESSNTKKYHSPTVTTVNEELNMDDYKYEKKKPTRYNSERHQIEPPLREGADVNSFDDRKKFFFKKKKDLSGSPQFDDIDEEEDYEQPKMRYFSHNRLRKVKNPIVEILEEKKQERDLERRLKNSKNSYESSYEKIRSKEEFQDNINIQNYFSSKKSERRFSQNANTSRISSAYGTNRRRNGSVHDRLYNEAWYRKKKKNEVSLLEKEKKDYDIKRKMIGSGKKYKKNITNRLYYDAMKRKKVKERELMKFKQYKQNEEDKQLSFRPQISDVSNLIASSKAIRYERPIEDYLLNEGQKMKIRRNRAKSMQKLKSAGKFSHRPKINEISKEIVRERQKENGQDYRNKFERLYEESFFRMQKKQFLERSIIEENSSSLFQPQINPMSRLIAETNNPNMSFYERMEKLSAEKLERSRVLVFNDKNLAEKINPETQKPFFQPLTGRSPRNRNSNKVDIGTYLYQKSMVKNQNKMKKKLQSDMTKKERASMKKSNQISDVIIEGKKLEKSSQLFNDLDNDDDGLISSNKISIENIPENILMIISPVLIEMEEVGLELDFEQFSQAMNKLYLSLSVQERNTYLFGKKKRRDKKFDEELTFKPKINKNTNSLVKKRKKRMSSLQNSELHDPRLIQFSSSKISNNYVSPRGAKEVSSDRFLAHKLMMTGNSNHIGQSETKSNPLLQNLSKLDMQSYRNKFEEKNKEEEKYSFKPKITPYRPKISHYL